MSDTNDPITSPAAQERVTNPLIRNIELPGGRGTLALITLDNGPDTTKPPTLGPQGLAALSQALDGLSAQIANSGLAAVAVTGRAGFFCAGADLSLAQQIPDRQAALNLAQSGHHVFSKLADLPVPTFALVNGVALGGGLELALHCDYRVAAANARALGLPETGLGLIPGWGGTYRLPKLVGMTTAVDVIINLPARNRTLTSSEALEMGLIDAVLDPSHFQESALGWITAVLNGELELEQRQAQPPAEQVEALEAAHTALDSALHGSRPAPYRALELLRLGMGATRADAYAAEDETLADLMLTDQMRASIYAFNTVNAGKHPQGAPDLALARPLQKIGVVGAGLMAAQLALLFAHRLQVPVVMRDLDEERVASGLQNIRTALTKLVSSARIGEAEANSISAHVRGTTKIEDLHDCDLIIEAVTEDLILKQRVFRELEPLIGPHTILATNTSALSVTRMGEHLEFPQRVVGIHFFNPVAQMPLIEIVSTPHTDVPTSATAFKLAKDLRKTAVAVTDRPGFIVNRLLVLLLGEIVRAVENGTPVQVADRALRPLGLPMGPFALFDLVGTAVGLHVLESLRKELGERFAESPGLATLVAQGTRVVNGSNGAGPVEVDPAIQVAFGEPNPTSALDEEGVLDAVLAALTVEIGHMLDEKVVDCPTQIDLAMILGAGWPFANGGICPLLDRTGYSQRLLGRRLLPLGLANAPTAS